MFYGLPVLRTTAWSGMKAVTAPHCCTAVPGHFGPKPLRPGTPDRPKSICFYWGSSGRTAFSGNNFDFGTSIEVKRTVSEYCNQNIARECYTQKDCEGVSKFKEMPVSQSNKLPRSITNKTTVREYNNKKNACAYRNQKYCQGVSRSKELAVIQQL